MSVKNFGAFKNVKAILIDVDNTLLDFNASAEKAMKDGYARYGLPCPDNLFETFKRINDDLWLQIERGEITRFDLHKIRWQLIFNELKTDFDGVTFEQTFLKNLHDCAVPVEGAAETLEYLAGKYPVYCASNAFYEQQVHRLSVSGLSPYITELFVSEKIGFSKPDARFFDKCFENIPFSPAQSAMIGDSLSADIDGGKQYGLITCWYNPTGMRIAAPRADFIVNDLSEIKSIF